MSGSCVGTNQGVSTAGIKSNHCYMIVYGFVVGEALSFCKKLLKGMSQTKLYMEVVILRLFCFCLFFKFQN